MSLNADEIYAKVIEAGQTWADCKSAYEALSDVTKTVFHDVLSGYLDNCKTRAEAETRAYIDEQYKKHLDVLARARKAWLRAEVNYKSVQLLAELRRTEESSRRAEMRL